MAYKVVVANLGGTPMEEVPAKNLQYSYSLNQAGNVAFSLLTRHPKCKRSLLDPGKRELLLYRDDKLVWGGRLWEAFTEEGGVEVRFSGSGWFSSLHRRYLDQNKNYSNVDQLAIAWDLIDFTQSKDFGDLGIDRFNPNEASGRLRDRVWKRWERKNIGEALEELSAVTDGFDFEITPDKKWKTYYPKKMSSQKYNFATGKNIRSWAVIIDAREVASELSTLGEGDGNKMKISVRSDSDALRDFGLLQSVTEYRDVKNQNTLNSHAEEDLRLLKLQQIQPQFQVYTNDPPFGSYAVGDMASLTIDGGYIDFVEEDFRITTVVVQVSNEGNEAIGVFFGEEGQDI